MVKNKRLARVRAIIGDDIVQNEIKAKKKAVADPEFKFRHEKDQKDLDRIKHNQRIKQIMGFKGNQTYLNF